MSRNYDAGPRPRATNFFNVGVVGRRTGITMKPNIRKDDDGLDNIDDFWDDESGGATEIDDDRDDEIEDNDSRPLSSSPSRTQQRQEPSLSYLEQELPEELLSTPTPRRTRNLSMSKELGSSGSGRALSLSVSKSVYDDEADEYQSPSFQAVKKRLVFTEASSDSDGDLSDPSYRPPLRELSGSSKKSSSTTAITTTTTITASRKRADDRSPALDRLLNASKETRATIMSNVARGSPLKTPLTTRKEVVGSSIWSGQAAKTTVTSRPVIARKAFELESRPRNSMDDSGSAEEQETDRHTTPRRASRTNTSSSSVVGNQTPAEFKRKGNKSAPIRRRQIQEEEEEEEIDELLEDEYDYYPEQDERETQNFPRDDRMAFSDEEEERDDVDERGPAYDRQWLNYPPLPKKRSGTTKETNGTTNRTKMAAPLSSSSAKLPASIPKKKPTTIPATSKKAVPKAKAVPKGKAPAKKAPSSRVVEESDNSEEGEDRVDEANTEDDRYNQRVPPQHSRKGVTKSAGSGSETGRPQKVPAVNARRSNKPKVAREIPVELVEVPIVPDTSTNEETGVRRSHRTRIAPLEFWKNERVIRKRDGENGPVIKAVLRVDKPQPTRKRKQSHNPNPSTAQKQQEPRIRPS